MFLIVVFVFTCVYGMNVYSCKSKADVMNMKYQWGPIIGCMVEFEKGKWGPVGSIRSMQ